MNRAGPEQKRIGPLHGERGAALIFVILVFAVIVTATMAGVGYKARLHQLERASLTGERLAAIEAALQRHYRLYRDLPDPANATPANTLPTDLLNLPQKYRFDEHGQFFHYATTRLFVDGPVDIRGTAVRGVPVAAVLVARGPDQLLQENSPPYAADPAANDDIVVGVALEAEAGRIARRDVEILQRAARAYDCQFWLKNNDADAVYQPPPLPHSVWQDDTPPVQVYEFETVTDPVTGLPVTICFNPTWMPRYSGGANYAIDLDCNNDGSDDSRDNVADGTIPADDERIIKDLDYPELPTPEALIDEDGYAAALPGPLNQGQGCVWYGVLGNDPDRGVASLDLCAAGTQALDLIAVFGLEGRFLTDALGFPLDPWGNPYRWGAGDEGTTEDADDDQNRDRWYWSFYSSGPDGADRSSDDITANERIVGYYWARVNGWDNLCL